MKGIGAVLLNGLILLTTTMPCGAAEELLSSPVVDFNGQPAVRLRNSEDVQIFVRRDYVTAISVVAGIIGTALQQAKDNKFSDNITLIEGKLDDIQQN
jgi:hypothetical protein